MDKKETRLIGVVFAFITLSWMNLIMAVIMGVFAIKYVQLTHGVDFYMYVYLIAQALLAIAHSQCVSMMTIMRSLAANVLGIAMQSAWLLLASALSVVLFRTFDERSFDPMGYWVFFGFACWLFLTCLPVLGLHVMLCKQTHRVALAKIYGRLKTASDWD